MAIVNNKKVKSNVDKEILKFWKNSRFKKDTKEISKALKISVKMVELAVIHGYASESNTIQITEFYKGKNQEKEQKIKELLK